jgi:high affinity Mn2+ porin
MVLSLAGSSTSALAADSVLAAQIWNLHLQSTVVAQTHPGFVAAYSGINSLQNNAETKTSVTATLFFGVRLWQGAEFYCNPEMSAGKGLSGAVGVAGFPNGEIYRVGDPRPTIVPARLYVKQLFGFGESGETIESAPNQLGGKLPENRFTLVLGKFALADFFDDNQYSHDPRSQFMNWALMDNGAWDYAADTRGYTWGLYAEFGRPSWGVRGALVMVPKEPNGLEMDTRIREAFSVNLEYEQHFTLWEKSGIARWMMYRNQSRAGNYREAIDSPLKPPDLEPTRRYSRTKYGLGLNIEQQISPDFGMFARFGWNDGKNETWAFTEIDRTASLGGCIRGDAWGREGDTAGLAFAVDGLSDDHAAYLAGGGYGFIIGDGALRYGAEYVAEAWYSIRLAPFFWLTGDYQFVVHPGYNRDRGPVHILAVRSHIEF